MEKLADELVVDFLTETYAKAIHNTAKINLKQFLNQAFLENQRSKSNH